MFHIKPYVAPKKATMPKKVDCVTKTFLSIIDGVGANVLHNHTM